MGKSSHGGQVHYNYNSGGLARSIYLYSCVTADEVHRVPFQRILDWQIPAEIVVETGEEWGKILWLPDALFVPVGPIRRP